MRTDIPAGTHDMHVLAAATPHGTEVLLTLLIALASAKVMAELFERIGQPSVVGEILAGVIVGPSVLGLVAPSEMLSVLAEMGVIFLLFTVGLETKPSAIFKVGPTAALVAVLGIVVPFLGGWLLLTLWGGSTVEALFLGTAMVATSVGITARVLSAMKLLDTRTSRIILGAAVIDDILGLLVLAVVASVAEGTVDYVELGTTAAMAIAFTAFVAFVGAPVLTRLAPWIARLRVSQTFFVFGVLLCLSLSALASLIGVAAIIGAFLAGMALAEAMEHEGKMHLQIEGVTEFLVPFFLVSIGMQLNLAVFADPGVVALTVVVTLVAVATKLVGCGAGAYGLGLRRAAQVGMGMVPRGEVGIVVAQIGLGLAVVTEALYGVVLFMAVATTLIAPPFLKMLFASELAAGGETPVQETGEEAAP